MVSEPQTLTLKTRFPVFALSCWALGLMAFSQLLIAGMALATRLEESRIAKTVVKEVPKLVVVRIPAAAPEVHEPPKSTPIAPAILPPPAIAAVAPPLPAPNPVIAPPVADPRSERLLKEARQARVLGDMDVAIMKLEDALTQSPDDPSIHYELGLVHELMGVFDVAAAHFEKVFQMGVSGAGSLYPLAAAKLRDGFAQNEAPIGKLSLARVRVFKDPNTEDGERVILTIPVQKAPAEDIDVSQISVSVVFFNRTSKGEIVQLEDKSWVTEKWTSLPFDWAGGEESLRMTYTIPDQDHSTSHLFGDRHYYGQVVTLLYNGEVLDVQAWPPSLAARIPQAAAAPDSSVLPEFQDSLPPDFNPDAPLLPALPVK
jgi:hypothetical protein